MPFTKQQLAMHLVAISCRSAGILRGTGTGFWVDVAGTQRFVTAAHVIWPQMKAGQAAPANEAIQIEWIDVKGQYGAATARAVSHPGDPRFDYAFLDFGSSADRPPLTKAFRTLSSRQVDLNTSVAAVGFPAEHNPKIEQGQTAKPAQAIGIVAEKRAQPYVAFIVNGSASPGFSGCPVFCHAGFDHVHSEHLVDDAVIGLMRGAPHEDDYPELADAYVLFGADSFS